MHTWEWDRFLASAALCAVYHLGVFLLCVYLPPRAFDPRKRRYQPLGFEQNGKWYQKRLRINQWKDRLPQHVGKGGFSKERLAAPSPAYLDAFILETCRSEWYHTGCLLLVLPLGAISLLYPSRLVIVLAVLALHLPFWPIQRYNRFRLAALKERLERSAAGQPGIDETGRRRYT